MGRCVKIATLSLLILTISKFTAARNVAQEETAPIEGTYSGLTVTTCHQSIYLLSAISLLFR